MPCALRRVVLALLLFGAGSVLSAQFGPNLPIPGIPGRRQRTPSQGSGKNDKNNKNENKRTLSADGHVRSISDKQMEVAVDDGRLLTLRLDPTTAFERNGASATQSAVLRMMTVHVDAEEDGEGNLTAVTVNILKDPPKDVEQSSSTGPATGATNAGATDAPDEPRAITSDTPVEAPDRPILRHGVATPRKSSRIKLDPQEPKEEEPKQVASSKPTPGAGPDAATKTATTSGTPPSGSPANDLLARTREWVGSFATALPNYVCEQLTTRYVQESKETGWNAIDIITAHVVYDNGKEQYRDITVGGRKTNKSMLDLGGTVSTGEFATTLESLFSSHANAKFKFYRTTNWHESAAAIYDFKVALRNSEWQIHLGGQTLLPAYSGSIWVDKATAQVRRIEMQADQIPQDFLLDSIQWAVDYDMVRLGQSSYLLPIHAENLSCERGSPVCKKNSVDFRNYHKFTGESTITFGQ
jgi:hypothetical protein